MRHTAEILTALAALCGLLLLTYAVAELTGALAWPVSGGLLLLSLCGWRLVAVVAWQGLYMLSRDDGDE